MKTTFEELEAALHSEVRTHEYCHVVVLYEDYESGWHAMRVYEDFLQNNCSDALADCNRWRFADLINPEAREAAIESLQIADLIIVAAPAIADISIEAQAALETGIGLDRNEDRTLIALFGIHSANKPLSSPLYFYLKDLATRDGFSFFSGTFPLPEADAYSIDSIRERAETCGTVLNTILSRQIPMHWGINE